MTTNELRKFQVVLGARQTGVEKLTRNREGLAIEISPGDLDRIQGGAATRAKAGLQHLLWSYLLVFALIAGPVGIGTMIAYWTAPLR